MYTKYIMRMLILFYLLSSFLSATHIHYDNDAVNDECQICIVVNNFNSADIPETHTLASITFTIRAIVNDEIHIFSTTIYRGFYSQAPPLFS